MGGRAIASGEGIVCAGGGGAIFRRRCTRAPQAGLTPNAIVGALAADMGLSAGRVSRGSATVEPDCCFGGPMKTGFGHVCGGEVPWPSQLVKPGLDFDHLGRRHKRSPDGRPAPSARRSVDRGDGRSDRRAGVERDLVPVGPDRDAAACGRARDRGQVGPARARRQPPGHSVAGVPDRTSPRSRRRRLPCTA